MHSARLTKSERLQRVLAVLKRGGEFSTMQIVELANVCAVNSIIAELRANGMDISCQRRGDTWFYRLNNAGGKAVAQ